MPQPAPQPIPEGMNTLTVNLWFAGNAAGAIELYKQAFDAELLGEIMFGPDGKSVMHAMIKIGNSHVMIADAWPNQWETAPENNTTAGLWMYVEDVDAAFQKAIEAGLEVLYPVEDMFWGDRTGKLKDPYGHTWSLASHKWVMTPEEIKKGEEEWMASMNQQ